MEIGKTILEVFDQTTRLLQARLTQPSDAMLALLARYERSAAWQGEDWVWADLAEAPEELARLQAEGPSRDEVHKRCRALIKRDKKSWTPLIRDIATGREAGMVARVQALVAAGADVNAASLLKSVPLGEALERGLWDVADVLIAAGADPAKVGLSDLHLAVRFGTAEEVAQAVARGNPLAAPANAESALFDAVRWGRPAILRVLLAHLAATGQMAAPGTLHCFHHAISLGDLTAVQDFLAAGVAANEGLEATLQHYDLAILQELLGRGADVHGIDDLSPWYHDPLSVLDAAGQPRLPAFVAALLAAGWGPEDLDLSSLDQIRFVTGTASLPPQDRLAQGFADPAGQFAGAENPSEVTAPWHLEMLRSGAVPFLLRREGMTSLPRPAWSADRFGQSVTRLPDGGWVLIGGEHEDFYDPDFVIFSDVLVISPTGGVRVFFYPGTIFPPTDFHTATRIGEDIWIIGNCGYRHFRTAGETPVHRLSLRDFSITPVATTGATPGWVSRRKAQAEGGCITISEGDVWAENRFTELQGRFTLDTATGLWTTSCG